MDTIINTQIASELISSNQLNSFHFSAYFLTNTNKIEINMACPHLSTHTELFEFLSDIIRRTYELNGKID